VNEPSMMMRSIASFHAEFLNNLIELVRLHHRLAMY
jgi:hypothetical protein